MSSFALTMPMRRMTACEGTFDKAVKETTSCGFNRSNPTFSAAAAPPLPGLCPSVLGRADSQPQAQGMNGSARWGMVRPMKPMKPLDSAISTAQLLQPRCSNSPCHTSMLRSLALG